MDGAGRGHRPGRAGADPGTEAVRRAAGPSHAWYGWFRSRGGAASRPSYEIRPRGHPDVQVDDPAGQGATARAHHVCGAQDGVRPVGPGGTPSLGEHQPPVPGFGVGMTHVILVVEDNERNLKLLRDVLEYAGFDVRAARTAEDGISLAVSEPPDLVLMDLQLPGIDGLEALRRLRASPRTAGIPVVAVTAQAMKHDRERALEAGFDGYVEKPISVRAFPGKVRRFLPGEKVGTEWHRIRSCSSWTICRKTSASLRRCCRRRDSGWPRRLPERKPWTS